jgi:BMFP domain-containing protein YqiC
MKLQQAEDAYYAASINRSWPDKAGLLAVLDLVHKVEFGVHRQIALWTAIQSLQELSRQRGENCDWIVIELEALKNDLKEHNNG